MTFDEFSLLACFVIPIVALVSFCYWLKMKESIGDICCNRCNYCGPARGKLVPFRGIKPVCQKCESEDWVVMNEDDTAELPQQISTDLDDVTDTQNHPVSIIKLEDGILSTSCPYCNYELKILENRLGSEVLCSSCRRLIKISSDGSCHNAQ